MEEVCHHGLSSPEVSSSYAAVSNREEEEDEELELGLSLGAKRSGGCRFLTAKDFPCRVSPNSSSASCSLALAGTNAQSSQVVGWPPLRARRINNLFNHPKFNHSEENNHKTKTISNNKKSHFVKVNMDGVGIGRKLDLNAHASYETLALVLEDMFQEANNFKTTSQQRIKAAELLEGSSEFVLTYEDKEGDWMLVGDVPWGMFLSSVRRLRIMKTSDIYGLTARSRVFDAMRSEG